MHAKKYIGVREKPPGSNRGPLIDRWNKAAIGVLGVSWCASFVHGMYLECGRNLPGGASVGNIGAWARSAGDLVQRPRRGDLVCFDWEDGARFADHIGFVERVLALSWGNGRFTGWIQTVEGNTSSGVAGNQSDGDGVYRRRRWIRGISAQFVRVKG
jgi:hypothetical protein